MKMLKAMRVLFSALLIIPLVSCTMPVGRTPVFEGDKKMHIGAWVSPPKDYITNENYKMIADSGINTIYALYESGDDALKALDAAQAAGIKYYVRDVSLSNIHEEDFDVLESMFDKYKNHPAFAGHLVTDEPGPNKFEQIGKLHEAYNKILPDKDFYVNLFPTYSSLAQRDGRSYKEYINEYIEKVKPAFISYDHYPLKQNVSGTDISEDFLTNLEIVSDASKKANIPFWVFIQAMGFSSAGSTNRIPDEDDIRWQVYTNLAFGAQGIQYFCYWTPVNDGQALFTDAMVDKTGKPTAIYTAVKNVNKEVAAIDNILLNMKNVGVMTFPADNKPSYLYTENPLKNWKPIKSVKSEQPVIIGCFEDGKGNKGFIIVNYTDPGRDLSNEVTINFNNVGGLTVYKKGVPEVVKTEGGKYTMKLKSGEGDLVLINK